MGVSLVGPVVGEVSALPSGSGSTLTDTGLGCDMAIGGLGFKLKIGDDSPYERATAQFKKDQFDNSTEYGDQSLLGFWTKGQFSFHKGAGVKYYDTLAGEEVLNRYNTSSALGVFEPGEVTLTRGHLAWTPTTLAAGFSSFIEGYIYHRTVPGVLSVAYEAAAAAAYTPVAGIVNAVTSRPLGGDANVWVATGTGGTQRIEYAALGALSGSAVYTHTVLIRSLGFAKGRIFAVDANGDLYQLAPKTSGSVAIAAGDFVCNLGFGVSFQFCDAQDGVYFADASGGRTIYKITLAADGSVPSLAAPVIVAELPVGERLRAIGTYLGFLILSTNVGIRVGTTDSNGGVVYGPPIVETADSYAGGSIAAYGSVVYVARATGASTGAVYAIDLSQQVGDNPLVFAYAPLTSTTEGIRGTFVAYPDRIGWSGNDGADQFIEVSSATTLAASGSLTTGFHRFGTLEPKKFHTVKMRCSGSGGTVTAYKVLSDGSEISLITIDLATSTGEDQIALGMDSPTELVGLKFVLTRAAGDATVGPTLLGYQLRALPAPKRQRLIRFPLMLMDVERRGVTRSTGYEGSAWDRLSALEDMEASGGVFQFQDFRTGEAGTCYIESVEHRGITPPGKSNDGYGGVVMLTVRKL